MSMLTSQCKQLHDMANDLREHYTFVGFGGVVNRDPTIFSAARQMDDAADTIERLREEFHYQQTHWELGRDENEELRELVRDALVVLHKKRYDNEVACTEVCPRWLFRAGCQAFHDGCLLEAEARDLGIELEL